PVGMPQRRAGRDFDRCGPLAVPGDLARLPRRRCVGEPLAELGLTRPFARFDAGRAGWPRWHWVVQLGIEHQPGDQSHPADPTGMTELHNGERAVADHHDLALRRTRVLSTSRMRGALAASRLLVTRASSNRLRRSGDHWARLSTR